MLLRVHLPLEINMLSLRTTTGATILVNPNNIVSVTEAASSTKWHGIQTIISLSDGKVVESTDTIQYIKEQMNRPEGQLLTE